MDFHNFAQWLTISYQLQPPYTKTPINANPMIAKPYFEKTNKCKNAMLFGEKTCKKFLEIHKKVKIYQK